MKKFLIATLLCMALTVTMVPVAFAADSREEVDRLFAQVRAIPGVRIRIPPRCYPEYTPDYYAFFFYDTEGIELEIVHFARKRYFL